MMSTFDQILKFLHNPEQLDIGIDKNPATVSKLIVEESPDGGRQVKFVLAGLRAETIHSSDFEKALSDALPDAVQVQSLLLIHDDINGPYSSEDTFHIVLGQMSPSEPGGSWALVLESEVSDEDNESGGSLATGMLLEHPVAITSMISLMRHQGVDRFIKTTARRLTRMIGDDPAAVEALMQALSDHRQLGPVFREWEARRGLARMEGQTSPVSTPPPRGPGRL